MGSGNRRCRCAGNSRRRDDDRRRSCAGWDRHLGLDGRISAVRTERHSDSADCRRTGQRDRPNRGGTAVHRGWREGKAEKHRLIDRQNRDLRCTTQRSRNCRRLRALYRKRGDRERAH